MDRSWLMVLALLVTSLYYPLNRRPSRYCWRCFLDDKLPLWEVFVVPYLAYFPLVLGALLLLSRTSWLEPFLWAQIGASASAAVFWYFFPNGVKRQRFSSKNIWRRLINQLYTHDNDTNGFPSAHVFNSWLIAFFLSLAYPAWWVPIWLTAFIIVASTVLIKQHYVVDIVGGTLWAILWIAVVFAATGLL